MKYLTDTVPTVVASAACLMSMCVCLAQPSPMVIANKRDLFSYTFAAFANWAGPEVVRFGITSDKMYEFLEDRENELTSGRLPKWSGWLKNMEKAKSFELRSWSLARRLEAGDLSAYPDYVKIIYYHIMSISKPRQPNNRIKPLSARIPSPFEIDISSVFWDSFEKTIKKNNKLYLPIELYAVWCFNTHPKQRDFIFELAEKVMLKEDKGSYSSVWSDPRYWIIVEWLYSWGDEGDFAKVVELLPKKAKSMFSALSKEAKLLPGFFDAKLTLPSQTMSGAMSYSSTINEDENNSKNENKTFEFNNLQTKIIPLPPTFPDFAKKRSLMTVLTLEMKIGKDGKPKGCRPKPGPWLAFFAPTGIKYAMNWVFEPAKENNDPVEARCILNVEFKL